MSGKRKGPPLSLSLALAASAGFVAVVGVIAHSPRGAEPSQVVLQAPVSVPAAAGPVDATPAPPSAAPLAASATLAASVDVVREPAPPSAAEPANLPAPSPLIPTVVLEATPTAAPVQSGRTGERVQPTQVEVIDATSRAS